jgi:hypothetical protein
MVGGCYYIERLRRGVPCGDNAIAGKLEGYARGVRWLRPQRRSVWVLRAGIIVTAIYLLGGPSTLRIVGLALIASGFVGAIIERSLSTAHQKARRTRRDVNGLRPLDALYMGLITFALVGAVAATTTSSEWELALVAAASFVICLLLWTGWRVGGWRP